MEERIEHNEPFLTNAIQLAVREEVEKLGKRLLETIEKNKIPKLSPKALAAGLLEGIDSQELFDELMLILKSRGVPAIAPEEKIPTWEEEKEKNKKRLLDIYDRLYDALEEYPSFPENDRDQILLINTLYDVFFDANLGARRIVHGAIHMIIKGLEERIDRYKDPEQFIKDFTDSDYCKEFNVPDETIFANMVWFLLTNNSSYAILHPVIKRRENIAYGRACLDG